jgi:general secretion pathway protein I
LKLSRRISAKDNGESGFTMIEAVVALALVAVVLAAIGSLVATNARGAQTLEQHVALIETARLIASGIPRGGEPLPDDLAGVVSGHRWQMRISPFLGGGPVIPESRFIPQRVELRVRSPSGAMVSFETVRLKNMGER